MDPLRLLSRSTKFIKNSQKKAARPTPSNGQIANPESFGAEPKTLSEGAHVNGKRKRKASEIAGRDEDGTEAAFNFFSQSSESKGSLKRRRTLESDEDPDASQRITHATSISESSDNIDVLSIEDRKQILRRHKLKVSWLNAPSTPIKKSKKSVKVEKPKKKKDRLALYPRALERFSDLQGRHKVAGHLVGRVSEQGYTIPTEVQLAALPLLLDGFSESLAAEEQVPLASRGEGLDLLTVAPTGSGKTLAFLIPLLQRIGKSKRDHADDGRHVSAIILAPTKELVSQIVNEGRKLAEGSKLKVAQVRKGMRLGQANGDAAEDDATVVKADILVSTPGILQSLVEDTASVHEALSSVESLVLDEADVLLDPLFREQTLKVWNAISNPSLRVSLWSATMGSNIEDLAQQTIEERRERLSISTQRQVPISPLVRLVVGLKDSAVPNVEHKLIYAATEQGKLMGLRQLIHPTTSTREAGPPMRPPFLIFTQTIERAIALHSELLYDIPAEAGGISRIAVLHSDLSDTARDRIMTRFRKGEVWVLITTDLLSRGVDFRGINGIVNYDLPTSSAAYVHRVGRTGRAGREGGVAVTLYSTEDIPYLKHVANVVALAQGQKGDGVMQPWLLDALPKLSKNDKKKLKKHGIESRTARGREKDPNASRLSRISTKAGFVRREANRKKGAIQGSQRRRDAEAEAEAASDEGEESDFGGFD